MFGWFWRSVEEEGVKAIEHQGMIARAPLSGDPKLGRTSPRGAKNRCDRNSMRVERCALRFPDTSATQPPPRPTLRAMRALGGQEAHVR